MAKNWWESAAGRSADDEWQNDWWLCNVCGAWTPKLKQKCRCCGVGKWAHCGEFEYLLPPASLVQSWILNVPSVQTLSKPLPAQLSACIAALERATARRNEAEEALAKASRDAEFAYEEVTRLVSEKSRVEQSLHSTQCAPSYLQSLSSSFHHVLSGVQSSPGVDENIVAQGKFEMETLFSKLNGLAAAVVFASARQEKKEKAAMFRQAGDCCMEALWQQFIAFGANRVEAMFHRNTEMGEGRRNSEDEKCQSAVGVTAPGGFNEGTSSSSVELDLLPVRGALGEFGGAGKPGTAKDERKRLAKLPKSTSHGRGRGYCIGGTCEGRKS